MDLSVARYAILFHTQQTLVRALVRGLWICALASIIHTGGIMNALLRKKAVWKYRNERVFWRLVDSSADVYVESVVKAGHVMSFLLYLVYRTPGLMLAIFEWILQPALQRRAQPYAPAEAVEPSLHALEARLKNQIYIR